MKVGLEVRTTGGQGRYDHRVNYIGTNTGDNSIRSEAVEQLKLVNEKVYEGMPQGSRNLVTRATFNTPERFRNCLRRAFVISSPLSIITATILFAGTCIFNYQRASYIADTNKDGVVSESEWGEAYKIIGRSYPPMSAYGGFELSPAFALSENLAIVSAYKEGKFSQDK
jgi:hypothetical protein